MSITIFTGLLVLTITLLNKTVIFYAVDTVSMDEYNATCNDACLQKYSFKSQDDLYLFFKEVNAKNKSHIYVSQTSIDVVVPIQYTANFATLFSTNLTKIKYDTTGELSRQIKMLKSQLSFLEYQNGMLSRYIGKYYTSLIIDTIENNSTFVSLNKDLRSLNDKLSYSSYPDAPNPVSSTQLNEKNFAYLKIGSGITKTVIQVSATVFASDGSTIGYSTFTSPIVLYKCFIADYSYSGTTSAQSDCIYAYVESKYLISIFNSTTSVEFDNGRNKMIKTINTTMTLYYDDKNDAIGFENNAAIEWTYLKFSTPSTNNINELLAKNTYYNSNGQRWSNIRTSSVYAKLPQPNDGESKITYDIVRV